MAASLVTVFFLFLFSSYLMCYSLCDTVLQVHKPETIAQSIQEGCFIGANVNSNSEIHQLLAKLIQTFSNDSHVTIGLVQFETFIWPNVQDLRIEGKKCKTHKFLRNFECMDGFPDMVYIPKKEIDRTCLLRPAHDKFQPAAQIVTGALTLDTLVGFVNSKCHAFRTTKGVLLPAGLHRRYILDNTFTVSNVSEMTVKSLHDNGIYIDASIKQRFDNNHNHFGVCDSSYCGVPVVEGSSESSVPGQQSPLHDDVHIHGDVETSMSSRSTNEMPECLIVDNGALTKNHFFNDFLKRSQPVIIKNGMQDWPALSKWSQEFLRETYGNNSVHVKITPGGDFEGVEKADIWENFETFKIPDVVRNKLQYPDLVVVRPAAVNMKFSKFLDLITWAAEQSERNVSAYLEYSSIPEYMPKLEADLSEFHFAKDLLTLRHLNMWLSDGNTLGRLHFDPYDNFLCQIKGKKQVVLFEPFNNSMLYEGHIQQATLSYSASNHSFRRQTLEDSTSMVMSPVDLLKPDFKRFPKFTDAKPLNCTIDEGDVLYMPSFWWHEVYSIPNADEKRNLAVNFWYEPFLKKDYPCAECTLDVNPHYHHLLY